MYNFWFHQANGFPVFMDPFQENLNSLYWNQFSNNYFSFPLYQIRSPLQIDNQQNLQNALHTPLIHPSLKMENQQQSQLELKKTQRLKSQKQDPKTNIVKKTSYFPSFLGENDQSFKFEKINDERNLMSNTVHQLFSFILNQSRSKKHATALLKCNIFKQSLNLKKFYMYTKIIREKLSSYLTEQSLDLLNKYHDAKCQLYSSSQQENYLKLLRILAFRFLRHDSSMVILTSKRMGSKNRGSHVKLRRKLRRMIEGLKKEINTE